MDGQQQMQREAAAPKPKLSGYSGQKRNKEKTQTKRRSSGKLEEIVTHNIVSPSTLTNLNSKYPHFGSYRGSEERQQDIEKIYTKYSRLTEKRKSTVEQTKRREGSRERSNQRGAQQKKVNKKPDENYAGYRAENRESKAPRKSGSHQPRCTKEVGTNLARAEVHSRYKENILRNRENEEIKHELKYERITGLRVLIGRSEGNSYSEKLKRRDEKQEIENLHRNEKNTIEVSGRVSNTSIKRSQRASSETEPYLKKEYKARIIEPDVGDYRYMTTSRKSQAQAFQPQTLTNLATMRAQQTQSYGSAAKVPEFQAIFTTRQVKLKENHETKTQRSSGSVPSQGLYGSAKRYSKPIRKNQPSQENRTTKTSLTKGDTISGEYSYRSSRETQPDMLRKRYQHNFNENYMQRSSQRSQRVDSAETHFKKHYQSNGASRHTSKGERTTSNSSTGSSLSKSGNNDKKGPTSSHYNGFEQQPKRYSGYAAKHKFIPEKRPQYEPYYERHPEKKPKKQESKKEVRKYLKPTETVDLAPRMSYSKSAEQIHSRSSSKPELNLDKAKYEQAPKLETHKQRVPQKLDEAQFLRTLEQKASMYLKQHNQRRAFLASQKG